MVHEINFAGFLDRDLPLIDVRSPGEYAKGHIPGAVNIPLFSDTERAHVGTLYTQVSREKAMEVGYALVNPKLETFLIKSREVAPDGKVAVHCWRGGMRSQAFARHLDEHGFEEVFCLTGGYKAYRNHILDFFNSPFKLNILGGYTGSGKTKIIRYLMEKGYQAVDLEEVARHKGSAFGALGQELQPSQEQFENDLFDAFRKLDVSLPIWLEDESHNIGGVTIPLNLYQRMLPSPVYFLEIPREARAENLVEEYALFAPELLAEAITRISRRLGGQNTKTALHYLGNRDFYELALVILTYYDKAYLKGLRLHDPGQVFPIRGDSTDTVKNANIILITYVKLFGN